MCWEKSGEKGQKDFLNQTGESGTPITIDDCLRDAAIRIQMCKINRMGLFDMEVDKEIGDLRLLDMGEKISTLHHLIARGLDMSKEKLYALLDEKDSETQAKYKAYFVSKGIREGNLEFLQTKRIQSDQLFCEILTKTLASQQEKGKKSEK